MSKLDVLLLTDNSLDTIGGSEESTKIIIEGLKNNFRLGVIQPGKNYNPQDSVLYFSVSKESRLKTIFKNPFKFLRYILKVKSIIRKENPHIIHTQAQVSFFIVSLLFKLRMIPKSVKFIHTERGLYIRYPSLFKGLFMFFMTELDVLVTTTIFNMNYWKKALNKPRYKNLDYEIIENTAGKIFEEFDENRKKKHNKFVVSFAGRYSKQKNWPLAVEIAENLHQKIGDELQILMAVGCLDEKSKRETNKMFEYLKTKLGPNFTGKINISLKEMDDLYYQTDVFIVTSLPQSESFGRTVLEAMSRQCIVLSTDAGGPTEIIQDATKICLSIDDFITKIMKFYLNPKLLTIEKEKNHHKILGKYSLENNINKHLNLYKESNYLDKE